MVNVLVNTGQRSGQRPVGEPAAWELRAGAAPAPDGAGFAAGDLAPDFATHEVRRRRGALALSPLGCLPPVEPARQYLLEQVRRPITRATCAT
jgi:hypothetical protein